METLSKRLHLLLLITSLLPSSCSIIARSIMLTSTLSLQIIAARISSFSFGFVSPPRQLSSFAAIDTELHRIALLIWGVLTIWHVQLIIVRINKHTADLTGQNAMARFARVIRKVRSCSSPFLFFTPFGLTPFDNNVV